MSLAEALASVPTSCNFAFSPDGRHVARLTDRDGAFTVEVRDVLDGSRPGERAYGPDPVLSVATELSFPAPGRLRICCGQDGWFRIVEARRVVGADTGRTWTAKTITECEAVTFGLLAPRNGADAALAISFGHDRTSTIWGIPDEGTGLTPLVRIPGALTGGVWLDPGRTLAINMIQPSGRASGYVIDLPAQKYHRWFHVSDHSNDLIERYDDQRGLLAVTSDCHGYRRVGVADLEGARKVRFFPDLPGDNPWVDLCGQTDRGLILRRQRGVVSELWLADAGDLSVSGPLRLPEGVVSGPVVQAGDRIRFAFSAPTVPTLCASYLTARDRFALDETVDLVNLAESDLVTPRIASFRGPRGDIEALVYEPPASRRRSLVVVALHGGPVGQWSAAFTPELQLLAGLGAVVVAPNYRGSTGYGDAFIRVLEGAGGSVDVQDVVAVMAAMGEGAGSKSAATVLYGHSYGAFLALLVAAAHPESCDGVIAIAPFTSLSAMRTVGMPSVQRLAGLLQGTESDEERADVFRYGGLRARVLVAHGGRDEVVPIEQSHVLCDRLRAHGYRDGRDLWFLPLPQEGHQITGRGALLALYGQIESFLQGVEAGSRDGAAAISDQHWYEEQDAAGRRPRYPRIGTLSGSVATPP